MIRFVIRLAFWFSLVLLLLPLGIGGDNKDIPSVGPLQAFFAARDTLSDITGFCERKPNVCEVGKAALQTIGARARTAYQFVTERQAEPDRSTATGTIAADPAEGGAEANEKRPNHHGPAVPTPSQRPQD